MRVGLVEHVVLVLVDCLCFPLCVVRDLAVGGECSVLVLLVRIEDSAASIVDIGFRGGHPVTGEVRLAVRRADHRSGWRCRSSSTAAPATTAAGCALPGSTRGCLADQHVGEQGKCE